mmetsp:Transcript_18252/g.43883  ORF Transcript_18252/g.43883 Transcript_18252/m.43883 type:complete len:366 (+) Transcript_18252:478-1575(+)
MPCSRERFISSLISLISPLKMRSEISGVFSRISTAATRPLPSRRGSRRWLIRARRFSDRSISSCWRRSSGKKLMMRSSAWFALLACSVAMHRWPVSANAIAWSMVSRSRSSPIRMTSGAWRSEFFSAASQLSVSRPSSRCVTMQFLCGWTNSIGSSMVTMWPWVVSLRSSIIAASEVLLPEPVAPTTMTRPRFCCTTSRSTGGRSRDWMVGSVDGMVRSTRPTWPCCRNALTRKRPMPCGEIAKLHSLVRSNSAACLSFMMARASCSVCWPVSGCGDTLVSLPSTLMAGGNSAVRKRSEPLRDSISRSRSLMNFEAWSRSMMVLLDERSFAVAHAARRMSNVKFPRLSPGNFQGTWPWSGPRRAR